MTMADHTPRKTSQDELYQTGWRCGARTQLWGRNKTNATASWGGSNSLPMDRYEKKIVLDNVDSLYGIKQS